MQTAAVISVPVAAPTVSNSKTKAISAADTTNSMGAGDRANTPQTTAIRAVVASRARERRAGARVSPILSQERQSSAGVTMSRPRPSASSQIASIFPAVGVTMAPPADSASTPDMIAAAKHRGAKIQKSF